MRSDFVAGSARNPAVRVEDGAIARDDHDARLEDGAGRREIVDDDRITDDGADERFVDGCIAQQIDEARGRVPSRGVRPATNDGVLRHDRRAALALARELGEELEAAVEVLDHHVFQVIAEETRESGREIGRRFDAIGEEAGEGLVFGVDERLGASADAFTTRMQLGERVQPRAFATRLRLRLVEASFALADLATEIAEAHVEGFALLDAR